MTEFSLQATNDYGGALLGPFVGSTTIGSDPSQCQVVLHIDPPLEPIHVKITSIPGSYDLMVSPGSTRVKLYLWRNQQAWPFTSSFQIQHGEFFSLISDTGPYLQVQVSAPSQKGKKPKNQSPSKPLKPRKKSVLLVALGALAVVGAIASFIILGNIGSAPKNDNESEEARPASISATGETTEVKVAFLGDSGNGKGFRSNLKLIREQNVDLVIHEGDFDYRRKPKEFWQSIKDELGPDIPYFLVIGNHDTSRWDTEDGYAGQMTEYLENIGIEFESYQNYYRRWSIPYKGLRLVAVGQDNEKNDEKDRFLRDELNSAEENWKICNWHKNQRAMQLGGKGNEMGWSVYETCREQGALIITGHEHSYERTKTLVNIEKQTVDPDCPDPNNICVGPGRSFVVVSGLGGLDIRDQQRCHPFEYPYGCKEEWAFIYTNQQNAKHGTLFITFNVDNNPNKAHGEFITIHGEVVDSFDITKD